MSQSCGDQVRTYFILFNNIGWEGWLPRNETLESSGENCYKNIKRKFPNVKWDAVIIEVSTPYSIKITSYF